MLVFITLMSGGLVAGLGPVSDYNSWPLQAGALIPSEVFDTVPVWRTAFEDILTVQFNHRMLAYATVATAVAAYLAQISHGPGSTDSLFEGTCGCCRPPPSTRGGNAAQRRRNSARSAASSRGDLLFCCAVLAYRAHRT